MPKRKYVAVIMNLGKWAMQGWGEISNKQNVRQSKVKIHLIHILPGIFNYHSPWDTTSQPKEEKGQNNTGNSI
jgi:hypothetical protein